MSVLRRNNVNVFGAGSRPILFSHGYGCDQNMWRLVAPEFFADHKVVVYDLVGSGHSELGAYDRAKYGTLDGHATDILEICEALDLEDVVLVGHSVSAMTAALAALRAPDRFSAIVMIGPSPCYIDDGNYTGGFKREDIDGLLDFLDANFLGWSTQMAPAIMGVPERPELAEELTNSFCRTDPEIAKHFAKVTFLSDHRADVKRLTHPTLILQCSADLIAPVAVGEWLHRNLPRSRLVVMHATGHCPHLSAPAETIAEMRRFLNEQAAETA